MVVKKSKTSPKKVNTGTVEFALKNFWTDYVGWGRARRSEYWWAVLYYNFLVPLGIAIAFLFFGLVFGAIFDSEPVYQAVNFLGDFSSWVWSGVTIVPNFCLCVRRLHDTNRSAWNLCWVLGPLAALLPIFIVGAILVVLGVSRGLETSALFASPIGIIVTFLAILTFIALIVGSIVMVVLLCQKGDAKTNRFGEPRM